MQFGKAQGSWTADGGGVYHHDFTVADVTFAGRGRPICGVASGVYPRELVRVDDGVALGKGQWSFDENGLRKTGTGRLTIHLQDDSNPSSTTVIVRYLFAFSTRSETHPFLSTEYLADPGMEYWATTTTFTYFNVQNVGVNGVAVSQQTTEQLRGKFAARVACGSAGLTGATNGGINSLGLSVRAGSTHMASIAYRTKPGINAGLQARFRIRLGPVGNSMTEDGLTSVASDAGMALPVTGGQWLRALYIFRAPSTISNLLMGMRLHNSSGGALSNDWVEYDDLHFFQVYTDLVFDPLLTSDSIPSVETRSEAYFGRKSVGQGQISLADKSGEIAKALASLKYANHPINVYVGGTIGAGGVDVAGVTADDWRQVLPGILRRPTVTDGLVSFSTEDRRGLTRVKSRRERYSSVALANVDPKIDGMIKGHLFGETDEFIMVGRRVDRDGSTNYGSYELFDPLVPVRDAVNTVTPAGGFKIRVFPTEEMARQNLNGYDITDSTNDFNLQNNNTRWKVLRDLRNYQYDKAGNDVGTNASFTFKLVAVFTAHLNISGPAYKVAADLQAALRAAAGGVTTINVTYSETTHKFTVTKTGAGTMIIICKGGPAGGGVPPAADVAEAPQKQSWGIIGVDTNTDKTIAAAGGTYVSDFATFESCEVSHIFRFTGGGYKDDASGSISGTASVSIDTPAAAISWILQKVLQEPVDLVSFAAGRAQNQLDFATLFAPMYGDGEVYEDLVTLARTGVMHLVQRGDGRWQVTPYTSGTTGAIQLTDTDILSWGGMWRDPDLLYNAVKLFSAYNPSLGTFTIYADDSGSIDQAAVVAAQADGLFSFNAYLSRGVVFGGLQKIGSYYGRMVSREPRFCSFSTRRGMIDVLPGDKVVITRRRGYDPSGTLTAVPFVLLSLLHDLNTGVSTCTAVEDLDFTVP